MEPDKTRLKKWKLPHAPWLKCNIGVYWSRKHKLGGASWILRNVRGKVLLHSRRCFNDIQSLDDAKLKTFVCVFESMKSHRINRVIFGSDVVELIKALERPQAWSSYSLQVSEFLVALDRINGWKMEIEGASSNSGALLIAKSVIRDLRGQSYVATGAPFWLK